MIIRTFFVLVLVIALTFALASCEGSVQEIIGDYEHSENLAEQIMSAPENDIKEPTPPMAVDRVDEARYTQQRVDEDTQYNKVVFESEILRITQISRYVYQHTSYYNGNIPCNGMVVVYQNKAIVFDTTIDDKSSSELIDWITESLNAEIIAVIPTHFHIDSLGGLNEFHNRGISSYAYYKTIQLAIENGLPVPQHGFGGIMELEIGDEKVNVAFMGEGHTSDNIIGYFTLENIMFGGCLIRNIGAGKGNIREANLEEWSGTVRNIRLRFPNVEKIIVGHGEIGGSELLDYTINLYGQFEQ